MVDYLQNNQSLELGSSLSLYAKQFQALGSEARLLIFTTLLQHNPYGLNVKDLQAKLQIKPSTLAHHLKVLIESGFVSQVQKGKESINLANLDPFVTLCSDVYHQCCLQTLKPKPDHCSSFTECLQKTKSCDCHKYSQESKDEVGHDSDSIVNHE